ncbi:Polysaccharide monooxygenase Cel61a like protein [Verticillium longisporum]|uniref:lytic cellulose monooxygenase (C4-dehydrogenating) n=1 Tax=Verticillium longisporum TaxID=100787 RepID=A0A8I3AUX8_VERLO|nr:Polysaccharide monooxygenase Cel61a like protein [Verticillium longisporum]
MLRSVALSMAVLVSQAAAHGYLSTFYLSGNNYEGYNYWQVDKAPNAIGWSFTTQNEGPEMDISSPDFVCRRGSQPSKNYAKIDAGSPIEFRWTSDDKVINPNGWAESHRGSVITYIAPCNGDCTRVDKTALRWTKIQEAGLISGPANAQGIWATDLLRTYDGWSLATIPASIASGRYVVRHELIALHRAHLNEPEFYMQCGNIEVTNGGRDTLAGKGVVASQLYSRSDAQLYGFTVYGSATSWKTPGPALYTGA